MAENIYGEAFPQHHNSWFKMGFSPIWGPRGPGDQRTIFIPLRKLPARKSTNPKEPRGPAGRATE